MEHTRVDPPIERRHERRRYTVIRGGRVLTPDAEISDGVVIIDGGRIAYVGAAVDSPLIASSDEIEIDANGGIVCPGFIDMHVHGGGGADTMDGTDEALRVMARTHAKYGTTALLPTTVTAPHDTLLEVAAAVRRAVGTDTGGAQVLGLHLEGPYINPKRAGAHNPDHMRLPTRHELEQLYEAAGSSWRVVTMAPEVLGAHAATRWLVERGVRVAIGHTDATYEQAMAAVSAGARHATHLFNAMRGWHHREPGCIGAILDRDDVAAELIADGLHVHPAAIRVVLRCKGPERAVLVTDCMRARDMPDGEYRLGDVMVTVRDGQARLQDGLTLAGSLLTMADGVRLLVQQVGVSLADAVRMAASSPARALGVDHVKGTLEAGKDADVVVFDQDLTVRATIVAGRVVYSR